MECNIEKCRISARVIIVKLENEEEKKIRKEGGVDKVVNTKFA